VHVLYIYGAHLSSIFNYDKVLSEYVQYIAPKVLNGKELVIYINIGYIINYKGIPVNREEKFIDYLGKLKNEGNAELLEHVIIGFKSLVEYRVGGNISERRVDIMENSEDMEDIGDIGDMEDIGDIDVPLDESTSDVHKAGMNSSGDKNRASFTALNENEGNVEDLISTFRTNPYMLTPELLKEILDSGSILKLLGYPAKTDEDDVGWDEELERHLMWIESLANENIEKVSISANDLYKSGLDRKQIDSVFSVIE